MVQVKGLRNEIVLIYAIDYLIGVILPNSLAHAARESAIGRIKTKIHGLKAVTRGSILAGWADDRAEVWKREIRGSGYDSCWACL
jgi:hypothetical protein